jgi:GntR family transcriptional repressor for pyruvate dehydrogenase complex
VAGDLGRATTAGQRLEEEFRRQIVTGVLRPGDRLPAETELSSHYGVSRNTAREALRAVASQGLLELKRGVAGGTFVAVPHPERVSGMLQTGLALLAGSAHLTVGALVEAREMFEVPAAELAALRRTDDELTAIRESLYNPRTIHPATAFGHTRDFHRAVLRAAHNPLLEIVAEPVYEVLNGRFVRARSVRRVWRAIDRDHREIIGYLAARDQVGARKATQAHLRLARRLYERLEAERSEGLAAARTDGA